MGELDLFKKFYSKPYFQQGVAAVPVFLTVAATSGIRMKKYTGFAYSGWAFRYKDGYGQMYYSYDDLERLWKIIEAKQKKDRNYIKKMERRWEQVYAHGLSKVKKYDEKLNQLNDEKVLDLLKKTIDVLADSVGNAHIIEPISLVAEQEFKKKLSKIINGPEKLNYYYAKLTAPTKPSFIAQEEADLFKIKKAPASKQKKLLSAHLKKYFWIQNTYVGAQELNLEFFARRMKKAQAKQLLDVSKKEILKQVNLDKDALGLMETIDLATYWQDQRKKLIQQAIYYLDRVLTEAGKRMKVNRKYLVYLSVFEIKKAATLKDIKKIEPELKKRIHGIQTLLLENREIIVTGEDFHAIDKFKADLESKEKVTEIRGSIANVGTAVGRVIVCNTLESLRKVKQGDVIVTSMTRPEYMIAIKKASAIVTDEGGITSHAAIVSREMNIPCIIGTKVATRVLKTGDKVEVRANHGFVRIIN